MPIEKSDLEDGRLSRQHRKVPKNCSTIREEEENLNISTGTVNAHLQAGSCIKSWGL